MADRWLYAWGLSSVALGGASLLVPLYFVAVGGGAVGIGVLAGVAALAGAPGAVLSGRRIDRTGRSRGVLIAAMATVPAVLFVLPLVSNHALLVVGNAVVWFAAGAAAPVLTLLVTAGVPEDRWNDRFGRLNAVAGWGWAAGLVAGTVWVGVGTVLADVLLALRTFFVGCALAATVGALDARRTLPADAAEPGPVARRETRALARSVARAGNAGIRTATFPAVAGRLYWLVRSLRPRTVTQRFTPALSVYFLAVLATFLGFGAFWGPLPLYLRSVDVATWMVFVLYVAASLGSAASFVAAGRIAGGRSVLGLHAVGLAARAVFQPAVGLLALLAPLAIAGIALAVVLFAAIGVAWAVLAVTAALVVTRLAPQAIRGEALGLYTALVGVATGVGSIFGGVIGARSFTLALAVSGGLVVVATLIVAWLWWGDRPTATAVQPRATSDS